MPGSVSAPGKRRFPIHIVVFIAPGAVIYTLFLIYPLLDSLRIGFFGNETDGGGFVGFRNYALLLFDPDWSERFRGAFVNSLIFFFINVFVQTPVALMLAALLANKTRFSTFYRTAIFVPAVLSLVIVAFVWQLILSPVWGVSRDLMGLFGLAQFFQPWLGLQETALTTLALISVWQFLGIPMMLFYAALLSIPEELTEAARIDGASSWNVFWDIKFPLLLPIIGIVTLLTYIGNMSAFDVIFAVKGPLAGPNFSTDTLMTFFYRTFFGTGFQQPNPVMGGAVAGATFIILMAGVAAYFFLWQRRVRSYEL